MMLWRSLVQRFERYFERRGAAQFNPDTDPDITRIRRQSEAIKRESNELERLLMPRLRKPHGGDQR